MDVEEVGTTWTRKLWPVASKGGGSGSLHPTHEKASVAEEEDAEDLEYMYSSEEATLRDWNTI
jgi:hypothetical protein